MLHLKQIKYWTDFIKCDITKKVMTYGDYYYEDDEDGLIIDAYYYNDLKRANSKEVFDMEDRLARLSSYKDYKQALKEAERQYLTAGLLDRKLYSKEGHK